MRNQKLAGYLLGAVAAISYGLNPLFALPLYHAGMDAGSVLFFRYLFGIAIMAVMLPARGHSFKIKTSEVLPLAVLGVVMGISSLTLFLSYNYMDAGIASTILFVYPVLVAVIMTVFFHERLTWLTTLCILLATVGISLLYNQGDGLTLSKVGTALVLVSALTYAVYLVGINRGSLQQMPTVKVTFYVLVFSWIVYVVFVLCNGGLTLPPADKWYLWGNLLALGLLPTVVSFLCTTAAIQRIGSTPTAILGALEPATAVFFGVTVFGETLTVRSLAGLILIVAAVSMIIAGGSLSHHLTRFRKLFPKGNHRLFGKTKE